MMIQIIMSLTRVSEFSSLRLNAIELVEGLSEILLGVVSVLLTGLKVISTVRVGDLEQLNKGIKPLPYEDSHFIFLHNILADGPSRTDIGVVEKVGRSHFENGALVGVLRRYLDNHLKLSTFVGTSLLHSHSSTDIFMMTLHYLSVDASSSSLYSGVGF